MNEERLTLIRSYLKLKREHWPQGEPHICVAELLDYIDKIKCTFEYPSWVNILIDSICYYTNVEEDFDHKMSEVLFIAYHSIPKNLRNLRKNEPKLKDLWERIYKLQCENKKLRKESDSSRESNSKESRRPSSQAIERIQKEAHQEILGDPPSA